MKLQELYKHLQTKYPKSSVKINEKNSSLTISLGRMFSDFMVYVSGERYKLKIIEYSDPKSADDIVHITYKLDQVFRTLREQLKVITSLGVNSTEFYFETDYLRMDIDNLISLFERDALILIQHLLNEPLN